jgi:MoaA/NifB/PqqE/SkfB family radical SAM enzyme
MTALQERWRRGKHTLRVMGRDLQFATTLARKRPFDVMIQVTNRCNMECSFCDFWPNPAPKHEELTLAELRRVSRELAQLGTFLISIEGGEPLIRKDLVDIVAAFAEHHIPALFTNGWYVTPDNAKALFDAGLVHASVSIDYPDSARHDGKRGLAGTTDRALRALETLRDAAPRGGRQVNIMSIVMDSNWRDMEGLFQASAARGVGHQVTLLATGGYRRGKSTDALPPAGAGAHLLQLWHKYTHVRFFRDYFVQMDDFLAQRPMPTCGAGLQSFNIDHVGNVSPCIERIDEPIGNIRESSLTQLHQRLVARNAELAECQRCWTACRGLTQAVGDGGSVRAWLDLAVRTRTV